MAQIIFKNWQNCDGCASLIKSSCINIHKETFFILKWVSGLQLYLLTIKPQYQNLLCGTNRWFCPQPCDHRAVHCTCLWWRSLGNQYRASTLCWLHGRNLHSQTSGRLGCMSGGLWSCLVLVDFPRCPLWKVRRWAQYCYFMVILDLIWYFNAQMTWRSTIKVYDPITFGFIHRNGVFGIRWKPLCFSSPCKILRPRDVDFKSYKRKCSESSEIVVTTIIITIYELSLHFRF